jgi:hypothetical protein
MSQLALASSFSRRLLILFYIKAVKMLLLSMDIFQDLHDVF